MPSVQPKGTSCGGAWRGPRWLRSRLSDIILVSALIQAAIPPNTLLLHHLAAIRPRRADHCRVCGAWRAGRDRGVRAVAALRCSLRPLCGDRGALRRWSLADHCARTLIAVLAVVTVAWVALRLTQWSPWDYCCPCAGSHHGERQFTSAAVPIVAGGASDRCPARSTPGTWQASITSLPLALAGAILMWSAAGAFYIIPKFGLRG